MRSIPRTFYDNEKWKKCKREFLKYKHYLCEECLKRGKIVSAEQVHHVIHLNLSNYNNPEIAYNWSNLKALCVSCHNSEHGNRHRRYEIRPNGEIETR